MVFSKKPLPKYPQRKVNDLKKLRSEKKNNEIAYVLSKIQKDLPKQVVLEDFEKARLFLFAMRIQLYFFLDANFWAFNKSNYSFCHGFSDRYCGG
jgi:hypothetical protein